MFLADHNPWRGIDDPAYRPAPTPETRARNTAALLVTLGLLVNLILWLLWTTRIEWPDVTGGFFA